ncbi:MAG: homoserine kinase [SAR202 cluster bacterium]|nr:homoserine kinase [SAR202 cluster bacterium]|tara:strand:- start:2611 stop:3534 length:924 start_codon:yes stop_codon:yes gene_type:complete
MSNSITVTVPATTANLGPGFDCLGIALSLWNTIKVGFSLSPKIIIHGEGENFLPTDSNNLMYKAAEQILNEAGIKGQSLSLEAWLEIPLSRGLGSSSAAIAGSIYAVNALLNYPLSPHRLLQIATEIEGHPDNVAPALMGGMSIVVSEQGQVHAVPVQLPSNLQCVAYIPDTPMSTSDARSVLEPNVSRSDAVFNIGRTALLVAALSQGNFEYLKVATQDRLHQPQRQKIFRQMKVIFDHAIAAGANGAFLSGAGSTIIAFTTKEEHRAFTIGYEMADAADKSGLTGTFKVLTPAAHGAKLLSTSEE